METLPPQEMTRLLADWNAGDAEALERLAPLVYAELRSIALRQIGRGREGRRAEAWPYRAVAEGGGADEV